MQKNISVFYLTASSLAKKKKKNHYNLLFQVQQLPSKS